MKDVGNKLPCELTTFTTNMSIAMKSGNYFTFSNNSLPEDVGRQTNLKKVQV
jgi:hypothetical protein